MLVLAYAAFCLLMFSIVFYFEIHIVGEGEKDQIFHRMGTPKSLYPPSGWSVYCIHRVVPGM